MRVRVRVRWRCVYVGRACTPRQLVSNGECCSTVNNYETLDNTRNCLRRSAHEPLILRLRRVQQHPGGSVGGRSNGPTVGSAQGTYHRRSVGHAAWEIGISLDPSIKGRPRTVGWACAAICGRSPDADDGCGRAADVAGRLVTAFCIGCPGTACITYGWRGVGCIVAARIPRSASVSRAVVFQGGASRIRHGVG